MSSLKNQTEQEHSISKSNLSKEKKMREVIEEIKELHEMLVEKNKKVSDLLLSTNRMHDDYDIRLRALQDREASVSKRESKCASDEEITKMHEDAIQHIADVGLREKNLAEREAEFNRRFAADSAVLSKERDRINAETNRLAEERQQLEKDKATYKASVLEEIKRKMG
jgi:hypothetical protein